MTTDIRALIGKHLEFLAGAIGPRPIASPGYHRAADYIRAAFAEAGLALAEIGYDCIDWRRGETVLAAGATTFTAVANVFSPAVDVTAPLIAVGTPAELENADITGKVVLFYGDLVRAPLIPLNCQVYNDERDQRINRRLREGQPAAVLTVNLRPPAVDAMIEDEDQATPSATVPAAVGLRLLREVAGQQVRLTIDAERRPGRAVTLIGSKPGPAAVKLTLMAHYDTKVDTPGASDNATGMAALLVLARLLPAMELPLGLEFIAFGDEEYNAYSDGMYVEHYGGQLADILVAINFDGLGQWLGSTHVAAFSASDALTGTVDAVLARWPGIVWTDPWPQSNHSTFAYRGVPSLAIGGNGIANIIHQPGDTLDLVSVDRVVEAVQMVLEVVAAVKDHGPAWSRPG